MRSGSYIVLVHVFIEGFRVSSYAAWIEIKSLFYRDCGFSGTTGLEDFRTHLVVFSLPYHFSFHALILFIVHFTKYMYWYNLCCFVKR